MTRNIDVRITLEDLTNMLPPFTYIEGTYDPDIHTCEGWDRAWQELEEAANACGLTISHKGGTFLVPLPSGDKREATARRKGASDFIKETGTTEKNAEQKRELLKEEQRKYEKWRPESGGTIRPHHRIRRETE